MGGCSSSTGYTLANNEISKCQTLYPSSIAETNNRWIEMIVKRMEKMGIKVHASEVVIYLCLAPQYRTDPKPKCYSSIKAASATEEQLKRNARNAFITAGSVSFCKQKGWSKTSNDFGVTVPIRKIKNITFNLQYKVIAIIFETVTAPDEDQLVMYQTHMLDRLLSSLAKVLVMAYSGQPEWSIPITWKIPGISLPSIDSNVYQQSMGIDHGFTSSLYAAILGNHMQAYFGRATFPHTIFSEIIQAQQAEQFINRPQLLDLSMLRNRIAPNQEKVIFMTEALNCLPFNLAYRTVKVTDTDPTVRNGKYKEAFTNALTNVMHYNVTLCELDLSGTNLQGLGIEMGQALAMNIQPLISRINFASCSLSTEDVLGLIPGLARSWCGGSSTPESINFSNNKAVSTNTWDRLFETLIDPTIFPFWPSGNPPPAAPLHYLQSVNMIGTNAASTKFAQFVSLLSGLRSISLESEGTADVGMHATIMTLTSLDAPLTSFNGIKMSSKDITPMLFRHHGTIKNVSLSHLHGNLTPLLMQWPIAVPNVKLMLDGATFAHARNDSSSFRSLFSECHCPGSILIKPKNQDGESHPLNVRDRHSIETQSLCQDIIPIISSANGLKALYLHDVYYASLNGAALASSSIKTLHVILSSPAENLHIAFQLEQAQDFWTSLAASKTLEELYLPNQFSNKSGECTMVGQFLRTNRSVRRIGFDGNYVLSAEDAKALRSAFYGNKKVISMSSFDSAMKRTIKEAEAETFQCTQRVAENKYQIKLLFKRHYSKYNYRWRDTPNRLKVPIVQNIATDKRRIGAIKRDNVKTSSALILMNSCITKNKQAYDQVQKEKRNTKMERKSAQFNNIAMKKQRIATKLVTKLHKAKSRGRRMKSGKTQVPRSAYYRSKQRWMKPNFRPPNSQFHHHSHYNSINDPYGSRFGYYHMYPGWNNHYFNDNYYHDSGDQENVEDGNVEEVEVNEEGEIDLGELNNDDQGATEPLEVGGNEDVWGTLLSEGDNFETSTTDDPWAGMDTAMENVGTDPLQVLTPEVLSQIHTEAAELGPDVSADISTLIDENSQVDAKIESIADGIGVDTNVVQDEVQEQFDQLDFDMNEVQDNLGAIPEYEEDEDFDDEEEDAVDMYAGGGPRDLDDGGSDFRKTDAAFAGACRRAKTRKINRVLRRVRSVVPGNGYQHFSLTEKPREVFNSSIESSLVWSNDLATEWKQEIMNAQVSAMSKSNLFPFPEVSNSSPKRILGWSGSTIDSSKSKDMPISVTLSTQCSFDRLPGLHRQLLMWKGKASVCVYVKPDIPLLDAEEAILSSIEEARQLALRQDEEGAPDWDIACCLVRGTYQDEKYPINFLRNTALLEARRYQQQQNIQDVSAILLVDVDFRPSRNLHRVLHCQSAARAILDERKIVVCPAFEDRDTSSSHANIPQTVIELKERFEDGMANGFHTAHFPAGHLPTNFNKYWELSSFVDGDINADDLWLKGYSIQYEPLFEPYIVMSSKDVPLYDERFVGYGLNKVSHIKTIVSQRNPNFHVLPGVFLVAPIHQRSDSWAEIYGSTSDDTDFNKLWLKGLYRKFLSSPTTPSVSRRTTRLLSSISSNPQKMNVDSTPVSSSQQTTKITNQVKSKMVRHSTSAVFHRIHPMAVV